MRLEDDKGGSGDLDLGDLEYRPEYCLFRGGGESGLLDLLLARRFFLFFLPLPRFRSLGEGDLDQDGPLPPPRGGDLDRLLDLEPRLPFFRFLSMTLRTS